MPGHFLSCLRIQLKRFDLAPVPIARERDRV
jgi:hypothetical protein